MLCAGMLLCDVPTPTLLLDHSSAALLRGLGPSRLDAAINGASTTLSSLLYVHASVIEGGDEDALPVLATLDSSAELAGGRGAILGLGLNNHFTGGYYWGRSTGPGAAMPAPGVALQPVEDSMSSPLQLMRIANSNDGKRSEWCEFLTVGDQVQLVPADVGTALAAFDTLVGITRDGHLDVPPGAEPIVSAAWRRTADSSEWRRLPWSQSIEAVSAQSRSREQGVADFLERWKKS